MTDKFMMESDTQKKNPTRVGVLLVHGIGEQKKFEDLEGIVRNIATALQSNTNLRVRIFINSNTNSAYKASQLTWLANEKEPVVIEVKDKEGKVTEIAFSEAWWADLGAPDNLQSQLSFWGWGLSLWSREQFKLATTSYGTTDQMRSPRKENGTLPKLDLKGRLQFFFVSCVVLLLLPLLSLLSYILGKVLGLKIRPDILVQYLGDIKQYQQQEREGKGF